MANDYVSLLRNFFAVLIQIFLIPSLNLNDFTRVLYPVLNESNPVSLHAYFCVTCVGHCFVAVELAVEECPMLIIQYAAVNHIFFTVCLKL
jgi:hypothetical protein